MWRGASPALHRAWWCAAAVYGARRWFVCGGQPSGVCGGAAFRHGEGVQAGGGRLVLVHTSPEWRGLALVAEQHNTTVDDNNDDGGDDGDLSAGWQVWRKADLGRIRYKDILSRVEGRVVAKLSCTDSFAQRQLYTGFTGANPFLTASSSLLAMLFVEPIALSTPDTDGMANSTLDLLETVSCSLSSDFSFALHGRDCVDLDTTTGQVRGYGARLGLHLPYGCSTRSEEALSEAMASRAYKDIYDDATDQDIVSSLHVDPSGSDVDDGVGDFFIETQGTLYFRGNDRRHGTELFAADVASVSALPPFPLAYHGLGEDLRKGLGALDKTEASLHDPTAAPQPCMETYLDGDTFYLGFVSTLSGARDSFHLEMQVKAVLGTSNTTTPSTILAHAEPFPNTARTRSNTETAFIDSWVVSSQRNGVGMTFHDISECSVDVDVGASGAPSKKVAVSAAVGGCSAVPIGMCCFVLL